jgi:hypothetical protein
VRRCSSRTGGLAAALRASDERRADFVDVELFAETATYEDASSIAQGLLRKILHPTTRSMAPLS